MQQIMVMEQHRHLMDQNQVNNRWLEILNVQMTGSFACHFFIEKETLYSIRGKSYIIIECTTCNHTV